MSQYNKTVLKMMNYDEVAMTMLQKRHKQT